jgi:RHS repeat-associated protein
MTASGQAPVTYNYDSNSRLRQVIKGSQFVKLDYDALNRRTQLTLPNNVSTEYFYDVASRITEIVYKNTAGTLGNLTYQYDSAGNRKGVGGTFAQIVLPNPVVSANYDAANRQLQFGDNTMAYDLAGNLTSIASSSGLTTLSWDARQRLSGLTAPGAVAEFRYDPLGRRTSKQINGQLTQNFHDELTELSANSNSNTSVFLSGLGIDEPWSRNSTEFYLADALGTVIGLTDASGALNNRYNYEPFGKTSVQGASSNTFQFAGRENDGTGLYYYRARYYSAALQRFVSEDPLRFWGGDVNLYVPMRNNPVNFTDAVGLSSNSGGDGSSWNFVNWFSKEGADLTVGQTRSCGGTVVGDPRELANYSPSDENLARDQFSRQETACLVHDIQLGQLGKPFYHPDAWRINLRLVENTDGSGLGNMAFRGIFRFMAAYEFAIDWSVRNIQARLNPLTLGYKEGLDIEGLKPGESYMPPAPGF